MHFVLGNLAVVLAALGLSEAVVWWFGGGRGWGSLTLIGGVAAAYSLDRLLDAPAAERRRVMLRFLPPLAVGAGMVAFGLWRVPSQWMLILVLAVCGGAYVPLKRFIPKGMLTAGSWAAAVVWLPCAQPPTIQAGLPVALCVLLIVAANAALCDALDVEIDREKGVRGLAPLLGARRASWLAAVAAGMGGAMAITIGPWPLAVAAAPLMVTGILPASGFFSGWRRTLLDLMLALPGAVALWLAPR